MRNAEREVTDGLLVFSFSPNLLLFKASLEVSPAHGELAHGAGRLGWWVKHPRMLSLLWGAWVLSEPLGWCWPVAVLCPGSTASAVSAVPCSGALLFVFRT